jgi:hypothetical protein
VPLFGQRFEGRSFCSRVYGGEDRFHVTLHRVRSSVDVSRKCCGPDGLSGSWGWDHPFAGYGTTPAWRRAFRLLGRASSSTSLAVCSASKGRSHASIRVVSRSSVADKNGEWSPSSSTNLAPYSSLICCWSAQDRQWSFFEPT